MSLFPSKPVRTRRPFLPLGPHRPSHGARNSAMLLVWRLVYANRGVERAASALAAPSCVPLDWSEYLSSAVRLILRLVFAVRARRPFLPLGRHPQPQGARNSALLLVGRLF